MLKKALRSLSSLGKNTRTHKNSIAPFRSRLSLEPLEQRRMLSAFDLSQYELHSKDEDLLGAGMRNLGSEKLGENWGQAGISD